MSKFVFLPTAYFQKTFVPFSEANISVATHALHYGTSVWGGIRAVINPQKPREVLLFRLNRHVKRLRDGARILGLDINLENISELIIEFLKHNQIQKDAYLRPLIYTSELGIVPKLHDIETDFLIYGIEFGDYFSESISCCFSSWQRQADVSLPLRGKVAGAYITSSLAKSEAVSRGFDDAIMLNNQGKISEGSAMNLFIVRDGKLITPSVNQDILEGITRDSIIILAKKLGFEVQERSIDKTELLIADEAFFTGTAARITSINKVENVDFKPERPITNMLKEEFKKIALGQNPEYEKWITRVNLD